MTKQGQTEGGGFCPLPEDVDVVNTERVQEVALSNATVAAFGVLMLTVATVFFWIMTVIL